MQHILQFFSVFVLGWLFLEPHQLCLLEKVLKVGVVDGPSLTCSSPQLTATMIQLRERESAR